MNIERTALVFIDLQNDFLHGDGAFGRADLYLQNSRALIEFLIKVSEAIRLTNGKIISIQYTLVADRNNNPIIPEELRQTQPFLKRGDFQQGRWGHQLIDELSPPDYVISKIAHSAFDMTHLDWLLKKLNIDTLIIGGLTNDKGISATVRDAQKLNYQTILLRDGTAAFNEEVRRKVMDELKDISKLMNCQEVAGMIKAAMSAG